MAAVLQPSGRLEFLDLRHFRAGDLEALLEEERRVWATRLRWDFTASCDLVRRYLDQRALNGVALVAGTRPVGYAYWVHEDRKALIGDLFVSAAYRTADAEHALLLRMIETVRQSAGVRRIEAQLMMIESAGVAALFPATELALFERNFMLVDGIGSLPREVFGPPPPAAVVFEPWSERLVDEAAELIARAYRSHIDSKINDQYETAAGARRFLHNVTQFPGCGAFYPAAAVAAIDTADGELCGVCLTSMVAKGVGHITQVCVSPAKRGRGVGAELLWRSTQVFRRVGCDALSLTVTANNTGAVRLYERIGFQTLRRFRAYVWRGWR